MQGGGRRLKGQRYFWAGSWPELCRLLKLPCQNPSTDRIALGSFRLDRPARTEYHEILVGNPAHPINRVYFPGAFRGSEDALMQIEFSFPVAEERSLDPDHWRDTWLDSLRALGILEAAHRVEVYDFKTRTLHFNGYGADSLRQQHLPRRAVDGELELERAHSARRRLRHVGADARDLMVAPSERLYIRVDASPHTGLGHFTRCLALAQHWRDIGRPATFLGRYAEELEERLAREGISHTPLPASHPDKRDLRTTLAAVPSGAFVVVDGYHFDYAYQAALAIERPASA